MKRSDTVHRAPSSLEKSSTAYRTFNRDTSKLVLLLIKDLVLEYQEVDDNVVLVNMERQQ